MKKDFQVPYTKFYKKIDTFECYHCKNMIIRKKSFLRYGCVPGWKPYILCENCAYKAQYGTRKVKEAKENKLLERNVHREP